MLSLWTVCEFDHRFEQFGFFDSEPDRNVKWNNNWVHLIPLLLVFCLGMESQLWHLVGAELCTFVFNIVKLFGMAHQPMSGRCSG